MSFFSLTKSHLFERLVLQSLCASFVYLYSPRFDIGHGAVMGWLSLTYVPAYSFACLISNLTFGASCQDYFELRVNVELRQAGQGESGAVREGRVHRESS